MLDGTKDFSGLWDWADNWTNDGTYEGLTVKKTTKKWGGIHKVFTAPKDGTYTFSAYIKSSGSSANTIRFTLLNSSEIPSLKRTFSNDFDWVRDSITVTLKANDKVLARYEMTGSDSGSALWTAGHKWEEGPIATPWMPSFSEVTAEDYPSYIGTYTDNDSNSQSADPEKYTWKKLNK